MFASNENNKKLNIIGEQKALFVNSLLNWKHFWPWPAMANHPSHANQKQSGCASISLGDHSLKQGFLQPAAASAATRRRRRILEKKSKKRSKGQFTYCLNYFELLQMRLASSFSAQALPGARHLPWGIPAILCESRCCRTSMNLINLVMAGGRCWLCSCNSSPPAEQQKRGHWAGCMRYEDNDIY